MGKEGLDQIPPRPVNREQKCQLVSNNAGCHWKPSAFHCRSETSEWAVASVWAGYHVPKEQQNESRRPTGIWC